MAQMSLTNSIEDEEDYVIIERSHSSGSESSHSQDKILSEKRIHVYNVSRNAQPLPSCQEQYLILPCLECNLKALELSKR